MELKKKKVYSLVAPSARAMLLAAMDALLMRYLGKKQFCLALAGTSAVLCVECASFDARLANVCPTKPTRVQVELGEYQLTRGFFKDCTIGWSDRAFEPPKTTGYKRVRV